MISRDDLAEAIRDAVEERGWRIREGDRWQVVLLPALATSRRERNRWPDEPEEGPEGIPQEAEPVRPRHGA